MKNTIVLLVSLVLFLSSCTGNTPKEEVKNNKENNVVEQKNKENKEDVIKNNKENEPINVETRSGALTGTGVDSGDNTGTGENIGNGENTGTGEDEEVGDLIKEFDDGNE
ncbi:hypothetical protein CSB07_01545 [Candidatus Gracilibacteria bacterium]|nr:MAG: hypothetical protein CSB07_01545 [Candidatus Gracilibacteria bacterium]PIE85036.1 MAG: hypothetical protein CSA08_03795 [Candidatus Gracilibacteria bacterium]